MNILQGGKLSIFQTVEFICALYLLEKEVLTVVSTAEMAQAYCDAVNRKQFCHNKRVFRPNSWVSRIFDRIGENFKGSALELMKK